MEPFHWPRNTGSAEGILWYAAVTDPGMSSIVGDMDTFSFGWGE